jgi:serine/threonine protein kinase
MFDKLFGKNQKPKHVLTDINHRFNLIGRVGQGSMSKVWKATDLQTGRTVALKILDKEKTLRYEARFPGLNKPSEGEVAVGLHHPNVVRTYDFGWTQDEEMFLVMEFIEGSGLSLLVDLQNEEMKRYRLRYMIQIGEALQYFHQQNWIHRDICPRNVMVSEDKHVKLIDFGLVVPNTEAFRKPGNRTGTASYMAPELIKRQTTDHRLDIFSYAVTCFEMYSKRFPWDAAMTIDAVLQHINKPPHQIKQFVPGIDDEIAATIMMGLAANPNDRWQHASEMVAVFRKAEARLVQAAREALARRKRAAKLAQQQKAAKLAAAKAADEPQNSDRTQPVLADSVRKVTPVTPEAAQAEPAGPGNGRPALPSEQQSAQPDTAAASDSAAVNEKSE